MEILATMLQKAASVIMSLNSGKRVVHFNDYQSNDGSHIEDEMEKRNSQCNGEDDLLESLVRFIT